MKSKATSVVKGIGAAMAIGGTAAVVGSTMFGGAASKRKAKKTAAKAVKTVENIIGGVQGMMN